MISADTVHIPILVGPIVEALMEPFSRLSPQSEPHWLVDCTLGGGGHCSAFLEAFAKNPRLQHHRVLALDQDENAIHRARKRFQTEISEGRLEICHQTMGSAAELIRSRPVLGLLADLGFSSDQLEDPNRGMSFHSNAPLDMRLDPKRGTSCFTLLQSLSEVELEEIIRLYGEERFSKRIAQSIVAHRNEGTLPKTTQELSLLVVKALPPFARHGRLHAATRTFQALRIAVNDELGELDRLLSDVIPHVRSGGRVAIISFHSLEDRKVKACFKKNSDENTSFDPLTKKPIQADSDEIAMNSRSRSAKLRIAQRRPTVTTG